MQTVNVNREELLKVVKANSIQHQKDYAVMIVEYKRELLMAMDALKEKTLEIDSGFSTVIDLTEPQNNSKEYDKVLSKLEMSVDEIIVLDDREYEQYVLDNWSWSSRFNLSKTSYLK